MGIRASIGRECQAVLTVGFYSKIFPRPKLIHPRIGAGVLEYDESLYVTKFPSFGLGKIFIFEFLKLGFGL